MIGESERDFEEVRLAYPSVRKNQFLELIKSRRSRREFRESEISFQDFSTLCFCADGITGEKWGIKLRTAPSAGALYPVNLFIFVNKVERLREGVWLYKPETHSVVLRIPQNLSRELCRIAVDQDEVVRASCVFVMIGDLKRILPKYGKRSIRYMYLEAGHISQNIYLCAEALGLGAVAIGAFYDDDLREILELTEEYIPLYITAVGKI